MRSPTTVRRGVALAALVLAGLPAAVAAPGAPAEAAAPTCNGQRATKVGSPGKTTLQGTRGRDVMVSNGSARVYGGPGNDLICITRRTTATRVFDGPGNDVVDARPAAGPISADVQAGNDVIRGTRFTDRVQPGFYQAAPLDGTDRIYLGAGDDQVSWATTNGNDEVQLGPGDDTVAYSVTSTGPVLDVFGGDGRDELVLDGDPDRYTVDVGRNRVYARSAPRARMGQFEIYDLDLLGSQNWDGGAPTTQITFTGSGADEVVDLGNGSPIVYDTDYVYVDRTVSVRLGAGEDRVLWRANDTGEAIGGTGTDELVVHGHPDLRGSGDLADQRFLTTYEDADVTYQQSFALTLWEAVLVEEFEEAGLAGDARANRLGAASLTGFATPVTVDGRGGDDVLVGGADDDDLTGGDGTDRANGRGGVDRCDAETTTSCEVVVP